MASESAAASLGRQRNNLKNVGEFEAQYVTFELGGQGYGINVRDTIEVIRMVAMAEPPEAPGHVVGVINIRGHVVPVVDMRKRLGLTVAGYSLTTPILVVRVDHVTVGLVVDRVCEVITLTPGAVEPPSDVFSRSKCVSGVAKVNANLKFLLNLSGLFSGSEAKLIKDLVATKTTGKEALAQR